jgi:hypothetical protein
MSELAAAQLLDAGIQLGVDGLQLLVDRLQLLLRGLELLVGRLQLLVHRDELLVARLQLLVGRFELLGGGLQPLPGGAQLQLDLAQVGALAAPRRRRSAVEHAPDAADVLEHHHVERIMRRPAAQRMDDEVDGLAAAVGADHDVLLLHRLAAADALCTPARRSGRRPCRAMLKMSIFGTPGDSSRYLPVRAEPCSTSPSALMMT